jgi:flagellar basal body-associated protein FliL
MSDYDPQRNERTIYIVIGTVITLVTAAICAAIYLSVKDSNATTREVVNSCVSNGGSWIIDGADGECWQRDMFFKDGGL